MTLTKADLVLTREEIETAVNPTGDRMITWEAAEAISHASAAKAAYALLDELSRQVDQLSTGTWTNPLPLMGEVEKQLEAAGLSRPAKSG